MERVVLDAMVLVSATTGSRTGACRAIYNAWLNGEFVLLTSQALIDELIDTLTEELKRPPKEVERLVALLEAGPAEPVFIRYQVMGCKDAGDDPLLEVALTGKASYLVTLDNNLLNLEPHIAAYYEQRGIQIVPPPRFMADLRASREVEEPLLGKRSSQ